MSYAHKTFGGWAERRAMRRAAEAVGASVVVARTDAPPVVQPLVVQLPFRHTMLTLDLVRFDENDLRVYNRLRAPFHNVGGLDFALRPATLFDRIARWVGLRVGVVGSRSFDGRFAIRSNAPTQVRKLFQRGRIRSIVFAQANISLEITDGGVRLDPYPAGVALLRCTVPAVEEARPLVRLFELFQLILPVLELDDRPDEDEVQRHIRRLRGPGGTIHEEGLVLWRGEEALKEAAGALAELGDGRAVGALIGTLQRGDPTLKARACEALGRLGHPRATGPIIQVLGKDGSHQGKPLRAWARDALEALDEGALAEAVLDALKGHPQRLEGAIGGYRADVLAALADSLRSASGHHAAVALAELDAVEVLPQMREALRVVGEESPRGAALSAAILELEARAALPRPADPPEAVRETLPRPAGKPDPDPRRLPRPVDGASGDP